jgi:hypothetical protein
VCDAVLGQPGAERAAGECGAVVGCQRQLAGPMERSATAASMTAMASAARPRISSAQPVISRVQQSIAASS